MMMSYAEAIEFINPAYNPNVDSFFPQPVLNSTEPIADSSVTSSNEGSLTVAPESFSGNNITNQPHAVELRRKKFVEVLRCEICNVNCNSISVLENHKMGKKHRQKTGKQNPRALMLDSMKTDECMEGVEITNVKNIDKDPIPVAALEEMQTVVPESFSGNNITNQPHAVELRRKKSVEVLRCEICNVSCNSISVLENHKVGKKHRAKTGKQNPQALMLDSMKTDECMEGVEITNVKIIDKDAIPGAALEEMSTAMRIICETQKMLEPSSKCSDVVSEIHIPKPQEFSTSVADNTCNKKDMDHDEIMEDIRQPARLKPANFADLSHLNATSGSCVRVCTVCNIFSNSRAELEKHLAGNTHARKVKYLGTLMSSSVAVYPRSESRTLTLATDTTTEADPASLVPVGCPKIKEPVHSDSDKAISSSNECTVCSIKCNSQEIFQDHLSERKHASKVRMLGSSVHTPSTKDQGGTERASKRGKVMQFAHCGVCKIYCNSSEILDGHMMGKKHRKQLAKLGK